MILGGKGTRLTGVCNAAGNCECDMTEDGVCGLGPERERAKGIKMKKEMMMMMAMACQCRVPYK